LDEKKLEETKCRFSLSRKDEWSLGTMIGAKYAPGWEQWPLFGYFFGLLSYEKGAKIT